MTTYSLDWAFAYGEPEQTVAFRQRPSDFCVDEVIAHTLSGDGEHFWLNIRKTGENTDWLAGQLAKYFSVKKMDVGYAGKKDRHAITTQWFSIYLPGQQHTIDWSAFLHSSGAKAELLNTGTHHKKLRRGEHESNRFHICLGHATPSEKLEQRLDSIRLRGVPNYFGEQRFGRDGGNLEKIERWAKDPRSIRDRNLRGMLMSAARSYLFNTVLSQRVADGSWQTQIPGEPETLYSGPLWGRGRNLAQGALADYETTALAPYDDWRNVLENVGLSQERRPLILIPNDFSWCFDDTALVLTMTLLPGQYATSVLREIAHLDSP